MVEDERALKQRLAALEAEVKADADAVRARREEASAKVRAQHAADQAQRDALRERQAALVTRKKPRERAADDDDVDQSDLAGALELAGKANRVKNELARKPKKGEKSWVKSGVASLALGPIGWLYAGSMREAIPATAMWIVVASLVWKVLPFLMMPLMLVTLPLSGIAGVVYALQYNRKGSRQRLFNRDDKPKQLSPGREG